MSRFLIDDFSMHCLTVGDDGPPLLLVHGFPLDHRMWRRQWDDLARDFRVIVPDLRGFGQSAARDETVTMERMADDLALLLERLGIDEPVVFVGLSMGGYVAWQFWARHRQKLRALVLCDTRAAADNEEAAASRRRMAEHVMEKGTRIVAEAMVPKLFAPAAHARQRELVDEIRSVILDTEPSAIAAAQRGMAQRPDMTARLGEIDVPALLIVGQHDEISPPEEMRSIAAAIPGAALVEVPDAGHMAPLENPLVVNEAIRGFVAQAAQGS